MSLPNNYYFRNKMKEIWTIQTILHYDKITKLPALSCDFWYSKTSLIPGSNVPDSLFGRTGFKVLDFLLPSCPPFSPFSVCEIIKKTLKTKYKCVMTPNNQQLDKAYILWRYHNRSVNYWTTTKKKNNFPSIKLIQYSIHCKNLEKLP